MYGNVKPLKAQLRVWEWDYFRAVYCGLCNTLKRRYGLIYRFAISYDMATLALALDALSNAECKYEKKRCIASPLRRKCAICKTGSLDFTADASVIFAYYKICDSVADKGFLKSLPYRALRTVMKPALKKASCAEPDLAKTVSECMSELYRLELEKSLSIDAPADTFARAIASLSEYLSGNAQKIAKELFYHIGRAVYIIDAINDMEEDKESGNYNPLILTGRSVEDAKETVNCSLNAALNAYNLADRNKHSDLIINILTLGLPSAMENKEKAK